MIYLYTVFWLIGVVIDWLKAGFLWPLNRSRKSPYNPSENENQIHKPDWIGVARTRSFPFPSDSAYDPLVIAFENGRCFATLPVFPRERSTEIPYQRRVSTQICVELLIGWRKFPTNQKLFPDLACKRHHYRISALFSQTSFRGETKAKYRLFPQWKPLRLPESQ